MQDEECKNPNAGPWSLRTLAILLRAAMIVTAAAAVFPIIAAIGSSNATITTTSSLVPPFDVQKNETKWHVADDSTTAEVLGPDIGTFSPERLEGAVTATNTSAVLAHHLGRTGAAALALLALTRLQRVVYAARKGRPFGRDNVTNLRIAGYASTAIWFVLVGRDLAMHATITTGDAVRIHPRLLEAWPFILAGAAATGMAEIFRHGADLSESDQLTI